MKGGGNSCWNKWLCAAAKFHHILERFFYKYGYFITSHPWVVMLICVAFTGAVGWGFTKLKVESRTEKSFVPQNSKAATDLEAADKFFTIQNRIIKIIIVKKDRGNMLTRDAFQAGLEVMQGIMNDTRIETVCVKINGPARPFVTSKTSQCVRTDPFELFNYSMQEINNVNIEGKINSLLRNENYTMKNGRPLSGSINNMLGGMKKAPNGTIIYAEALRIDFPMHFPKIDADYENVLTWEGKFLEYITSLKKRMSSNGIEVFFFTFKSIDDSVNDSTGSDIIYITITFSIMCTFTCFSLGRFRQRVTGHGLAGMVGLLVVGMGIVSSFGLILLCGGTFIATIGILPFLILGVAIDDMFIILDELDRADFRLPNQEIVAKVLARVGGSVTMTTLTDLVAFAVSTTSAFPAIRYFCMFAAVGLTFSYMMIMTFFVAYLVFEVNRIKKGRLDMMPCLTNPKFEIDSNTGLIVSPKTQISTTVMRKLGGFLTNRIGSLFVIIISVGLISAGVVGALSISETFTLQMLGKDGSEYIKYLDTENKYFKDIITISIVVPGSFKVDTNEGQSEYSKLSKLAIKSHKYMMNESIDWLNEFQKWSADNNSNTTGADFLKSLGDFLSIPKNGQYLADIKFSTDKKHILASRVVVFMVNSQDSSKGKDTMLELRKSIEDHSTIKPYIAAVQFLYFEQYVLVIPETTRNVIICGITVLLMTAPFLLHPGILVLMVVSFAALIFELLGLMAIWNVSLNSISMIILTMAIGFCVDYSAHIAHAYVISDAADAKTAIIDALSTTGASVFMGGFTTFLGMLVTAFASSEIFRIFFKMFLGIVGLGLFHGLVILPTLIALCKISRSPTNGGRTDSRNSVTSEEGHSMRNGTAMSVHVPTNGHKIADSIVIKDEAVT